MRLEPLYRIRFNYPENWVVDLEGGWEQHLMLAEGECEGFISGRFRGANFPQRRTVDGPFRPARLWPGLPAGATTDRRLGSSPQ